MNTVNGFKQFVIFAKYSFLDVCHGSEYAYVFRQNKSESPSLIFIKLFQKKKIENKNEKHVLVKILCFARKNADISNFTED